MFSVACGPPDFHETCRSACHHLIDDCYSQVSKPDFTYDEGSCEADCSNPITWCDAGAVYACVEGLDCNRGYPDLASCFTDPSCTTIADAGPVQGRPTGPGSVELDPESLGQPCLGFSSPDFDLGTLGPGLYSASQGDPGQASFFVGGTSFDDGGSITLLANDGMNIAGTFELSANLFGDAGTCLLRGNFEIPAITPSTVTPACACTCPDTQTETESDCSSGGVTSDPFLVSVLAILGLRVRQRRSRVARQRRGAASVA